MDVDDTDVNRSAPVVLEEKIYPTEVMRAGLQRSDQWKGTKASVRQSTALHVLFVMMLAREPTEPTQVGQVR